MRNSTACFALTATAVIITQCSKPPPDAVSTASTGSSAAESGPAWFEERAAARGLDFTHRSGHGSRHLMPEIMGGGAALLDMDNDGLLDAFLVQSGSLSPGADPPASHRLFRNAGAGRFEDVTHSSGVASAGASGYGMGAACGDVDNDGLTDLYVTSYGPNQLLRNLGAGRFEDVTAAAGVGLDNWSTGAAFFDFDRDGDLDLYVATYLNWSIDTEISCYNDMGAPDFCSPKNYNAPAIDVLFRNNGDGTFTDITTAAGIDRALGTGLGVACADFNADGWLDVFVANDGMPNQLWVNQRDGTFIDEALLAGCAIDMEGKAKAGMGVTVADFDDDGREDVLVCNLNTETDSLFRNIGGNFSDHTRPAGLAVTSRPFTRFGMALLDFNNDGHLDLYQANGRVMRQSVTFGDDPFAEPNLLKRGLPRGRFEEVKPRGGTAALLVATSRAAAFGDIDNDGGMDILIVNRDGPAHLLSNIVPSRGNWIGFRVIDEHGRDALNAVVTLKLGDRTITREVRAAYSYLASNDPRVHVGLGDADKATHVQVRWIDGAVESFGDLPAGEYHRLVRSVPVRN